MVMGVLNITNLWKRQMRCWQRVMELLGPPEWQMKHWSIIKAQIMADWAKGHGGESLQEIENPFISLGKISLKETMCLNTRIPHTIWRHGGHFALG